MMAWEKKKKVERLEEEEQELARMERMRLAALDRDETGRVFQEPLDMGSSLVPPEQSA